MAGGAYKLRLYPNATIAAATQTVTPGSAIIVRWSLAIASDTDWVGLFDLNAPSWQERIAWRYTTGGGTGTVELLVPIIEPGEYELRLYARNGGNEIARSSPIAVIDPVMSFVWDAPADPIPADLNYLLPRAKAAAMSQTTTWSKAEAVRRVVREAVSEGSCWVLSYAYWSIGRILGLPLRVITASANAENPYDTHTTVEVWVPELSRWMISDPTFDGYWSRGSTGDPIGALDIRDAIRSDALGDIYWHPSSTTNAADPSDYYVNPLHLYAKVWVQSDIAGITAWTSDEDGPGLGGPNNYRVKDARDLRSAPPDASVRVSVMSASSQDYYFGNPPRYTRSTLLRTRATLESDGSISLELGYSGVIVVTVADGGRWSLLTEDQTYDLSPNFGIQISPIVAAGTMIKLVAETPSRGDFDIAVYDVDHFPRTNEVASP